MGEMLGGSFTGFTESRKFVLALYCPSLTVTVIVAVPDWFVAGVTVTVRFAPEPPKVMFADEASVGLDEALLRVKRPGAVSASPIVKLMGAVAASSLMV